MRAEICENNREEHFTKSQLIFWTKGNLIFKLVSKEADFITHTL
jgi:hypothetical protein